MSNPKVIIAIDFGTSNTGFGYSFPDPQQPDVIPNSLKIYGNERWGDLKTNTAILFSVKDHELSKPIAFGKTAINKYLNISLRELKNYELFRYFKMNLYDNQSNVTSEGGKTYKLRVVIQGVLIWMKIQSIKFVNKEIQKGIYQEHFPNEHLGKIGVEDVQWVLTIPAIWSERAKFQMRKVAYQAKLIKELNSERLLFALEPEAAAIHNYYGLQISERFTEPKCLIVDAGGGTVDITALKISKDLEMENQLEVLIAPKGGDFGANYVDREFQKFLVAFFAHDESFMLNDKLGYQSMLVEWEQIKKNVTLEFRGQAFLKHRYSIPPKLIPKNTCLEKLIANYNKKSEYKIQICGEKNIFITREHLFSFFEHSIKKLISHLHYLFKNYGQLKDCNRIVMVGGYSKSGALVGSIQEAFKDHNKVVTAAKDPGRHVIMGAVRYGFQPNIIRWRRLNCTYGLKVSQIFNKKSHKKISDRKRKPQNSNFFLIDNIFKPFVYKNERIEHSDKFNKTCAVLIERQSKLRIDIFKTQSDLIKNKTYFLDQMELNFKRVGKVSVKYPQKNKKRAKKYTKLKKNNVFKINLTIEFGRSEFTILIIDYKTQKILENARLQLFGHI
ncbi:alpha kinase/elongation factor 2 kinase [Anaeramoeba flamelloides]|uniref:Alpha kinase/elongation factor 2 kinase n=1 Tax=Anaeramoeba flamelloides TaxID=1746091 RepID=A0ABQ8X699_9EUKA|nr:alpha kinase/elongation factor 2 kinase [Anaeramoeba flamelloides]